MFKKYLGGEAFDDYQGEILISNYRSDNPEAWKVRPCEWYQEENRNCKNFFQRFNQKFIYGKGLDCDQWSRDYKNCLGFRNTGDEQLMQKVIDSENKRITKFVVNSERNDIWESRTEPPPNWNRKLPDWWNERTKESRLKKYMEILEEEKNKN
ncbi:UPF0545 protein C22orf39 homolog [Panonychus citri]|uniref:UPF0545 protein C22orf39 homolog n=1 Tax=Panonychus citri TaxID=50023 RepID=UPI002306EF24|nr:UPF0545 protein C22orf39 homolog [Panonychus citri]